MTGEKRFQEDDFPDDDAVFLRTSEGAVVLPASARRLDPEQLGTVRDLQRVGLQIATLEGQAEELAREARELGVSWSLIGFALGLTGEATRRRYSE